MQNQSDAEWAWVAGLLEGEGYFGLRKQGGRGYYVAEICCAMTDRDVVERLGKVTGFGSVRGPRNKGERRKPLWEWRVSKRQDVKAVCEKCLPWLGSRRRERVLSILASIPEEVPYPVEDIKRRQREGAALRTIAEEFGICYSIVQRICSGKVTSGNYRIPMRPASLLF